MTHIETAPRWALKEWSATCDALLQGRQILLLRKGGILDEDGVFQLEHQRFWLQPTFIHQDVTLVQPPHRDLLENVQQSPGENRDFIRLRGFAEAVQVFPLHLEDEDKLKNVAHIYSANYLDLRFSYKPEHPLLCVALRVFDVPEYSQFSMKPEWTGCRSWIELDAPPSIEGARPALDEATFAAQLDEVRRALTG